MCSFVSVIYADIVKIRIKVLHIKQFDCVHVTT